jgi:predicted RNA-binding Zn ribbon-like protein
MIQKREVMSRGERRAANLELIGGAICLDFANTTSTRSQEVRRDYLPSYGELLAWCRHAGILTGDETKALQGQAARQPDMAASVLERAIALRETLYRIFAAIAQAQPPAAVDLMALNAALRQALARLEVVPTQDGFEWGWAQGEDDLDCMLWPIVRSAADLLTSESVRRVRQCARQGCDWLFVDTSKNRSRRWCTMDVCGSRVKMRRYYQRRKQEQVD